MSECNHDGLRGLIFASVIVFRRDQTEMSEDTAVAANHKLGLVYQQC